MINDSSVNNDKSHLAGTVHKLTERKRRKKTSLEKIVETLKGRQCNEALQ